MTMICLLSFYKSYQNVKYELQEESQTLFQRAVQDDTNRRIKDLGDAFCFSYSGANRSVSYTHLDVYKRQIICLYSL